jgi:hypothetical protein
MKCFEEKSPVCGKHANEYISDLVDTRDEITKAFPDRDQCASMYPTRKDIIYFAIL